MKAIFRGRRCFAIGHRDGELVLQGADHVFGRVHVRPDDPDLILDPAADDLELAAGFELGEINAFEYPDGHTFPPDREIVRRPGLTPSTTADDRRDLVDDSVEEFAFDTRRGDDDEEPDLGVWARPFDDSFDE